MEDQTPINAIFTGGGAVGTDLGWTQGANLSGVRTGGWVPLGYKGGQEAIEKYGFTENDTDSHRDKDRKNLQESDMLVTILQGDPETMKTKAKSGAGTQQQILNSQAGPDKWRRYEYDELEKEFTHVPQVQNTHCVLVNKRTCIIWAMPSDFETECSQPSVLSSSLAVIIDYAIKIKAESDPVSPAKILMAGPAVPEFEHLVCSLTQNAISTYRDCKKGVVPYHEFDIFSFKELTDTQN